MEAWSILSTYGQVMPESIASKQPPRICYVSMPYGRKPNPTTGEAIDFDSVYQNGIEPAIRSAGLDSIRTDNDGIFHKPRFSHLLTADCCIFDLTTANPNVLYELGIRHAARAGVTIAIFSRDARPWFDLDLIPAIPYELTGGRLSDESASKLRAALTSWLNGSARGGRPDSPLFVLFDGFPGVDTALMEHAPKVFFSYARADVDHVQKLYERFSRAGFKPWMDKFDILPGEDWHRQIDLAIQQCDFFLAFLSPQSVNRRGIIQTEFRRAFEKADQMLDSDIYLIPVRLEPCEVPDNFRSRQWVDLFEDNGWSLLNRALKVGIQRRKDLAVPETRD